MFSLILIALIEGITIVAPRGRGTPGGFGGGKGLGSPAPIVCRKRRSKGGGPRSPIISGIPPAENPSRLPYIPGPVASAEPRRSSGRARSSSARSAVESGYASAGGAVKPVGGAAGAVGAGRGGCAALGRPGGG